VRRPTLDDVFLALTGHRLRDDGDLAATGATGAAIQEAESRLQEVAS
jgi:hypothetical protein